MNPIRPMDGDPSDTKPLIAKSGRRWCQYSLRTLLLVMTLAAVGMSWFAVHRRDVYRQREIVKRIDRNGGYVRYDYQAKRNRAGLPKATPPGPGWLRQCLGDDFFAHVIGVSWFGNRPPGDDDLRHVSDLPRLESIAVIPIYGTGGPEGYPFTAPVTDAGLAHIARLRRLRSLGLRHTQITDTGMKQLGRMRQLEELDVGYCHISDVGLRHLDGLVNLKELNLTDTQITDTGLPYLEGMTQLHTLDLQRTRITDEGLRHLNRMTQLTSLSLAHTQVTDLGLVHIEKLDQMQSLDLGDTQLTDAGLIHLRGMRKLADLDLCGTRITDAGLQTLRCLPSLRTLHMDRVCLTDAAIESLSETPLARDFLPKFGTPVTDKGVKELQRALPNLEIP